MPPTRLPSAMYTLLFALTLIVSAIANPPPELFSPLVPQKVLATFKALPNPIKYPQYTNTNGTWQYFNPDTWTSGFFPATGYALNTRKRLCGASDANKLGIADWVALSRAASTGLIPLERKTSVGHDVGFLSFPFIEELAVNPSNATAKAAINAFAKALADRFDPTVGCTRSWDKGDDPTDFMVIIDNMMNLDVLFQSEKLTGNSTLRKIAIAHADATMKNHIRDDGSTWHLVEYNSTTGAVIRKRTVQGFSDNSTWSRGQAWAIYGFANMYSHTGDDNYLVTARRLANYFLDNLPKDGIVPWDFNAPLTPAPRPADSSAATIAATGLLLLSRQEANSKTTRTKRQAAKVYKDAAINLLKGITPLAWRPSWQSLLANGTVHYPINNAFTGITYGDYYFVKVGNDLVSQGLAKCS